MIDFQGKVAVITGGASGIGRAMAERFAEEGMRIVLADVDEVALAQTTSELQAEGAEVLSVVCDVSKQEDVEALAKQAVEAFDTVHILCNNAGVEIEGCSWEIPLDDWDRALGVNLWGVIHGNHYFTPVMIENGDPCHIVNRSFFSGVSNGINMTPTQVSSTGVVSISESMHKELRAMDSNINISLLSPEGSDVSPETVSQMVLDAIVSNAFYVIAQPDLSLPTES